jgi:hypothetical protein
MSATTIALFRNHLREQGKTQPPPPLAGDVRRSARKLTAEAGRVLAIANASDQIAARVLRRIGASILDDALALSEVASAMEETGR